MPAKTDLDQIDTDYLALVPAKPVRQYDGAIRPAMDKLGLTQRQAEGRLHGRLKAAGLVAAEKREKKVYVHRTPAGTRRLRRS